VVSKFGSQTLVQFCLEIWRKFNSKWGTRNCFESERLHRTTSRRAAPRRARSPRPPHGPKRRGNLPPAGPRAVGPPASNRHPDPLPVRHVLTPAAPATQRRRRRTRAAPPGWQLAVVRCRPSRRTPAMPCLYCLAPRLGVQGSTQPPRAGL
jgi:hypothetical protein